MPKFLHAADLEFVQLCIRSEEEEVEKYLVPPSPVFVMARPKLIAATRLLDSNWSFNELRFSLSSLNL